MQRRLTRPRDDDGVSLIEMLVAVLILSIGVVAAYQTLGQSRRAIGDELPRLLAREVALNRAAELRILGAGLGRGAATQVPYGPYVWTVIAEGEATEGGFIETTIRVSAPGLPGAAHTVYVPTGALP